MNTYCSRPYLNRLLCQCLSVGTLTTLSLLLGLAPNLSGRSPTLVFSSAAYADSYSNSEIRSVASAILKIEPYRQEAYKKIKEIIGSPPNIGCDQRQSLETLPGNAKAIAENFCNQSQKIVESTGLNNPRFNEIISASQSDRKLEKQIQDAMESIRKGK